MRRPTLPMDVFKDRRKRLTRLAPDSAFILPSHPDYIRNHDVHHSYRQDSNFFYLTGFEEPNSILVIRPGQTPESVLFVRPKDPFRETWDGFRYGPEGARQEFAIDQTFLIDDFDKQIVELLKPVVRVYYRWNIDPEFDRRVLGILSQVKASLGRSGRSALPVHDTGEVLGEMRLKKTDYEIETMRRACGVTARAHLELMKYIRPGMNERELHGRFVYEIFKNGASREGYGTIVAAGANATTLHYVYNDQICHDGELILIDAGAEVNYYTGDITRTFPVGGKFTPAQKRVYEVVLEVQKSILGMVKPGIPFKNLQEAAIEKLTDGMIELGLLKGSRAPLIERQDFKKYYMHGVGHWLGMDVHDAGLYLTNGESRAIEEGMSFTIEPGLYIPFNDMGASVDMRGIGIRIEDNVVVTTSGCENMTVEAPKEIGDLEAVIGSSTLSKT